MFKGVYWNQPVCPSMCMSVHNVLVSVKALSFSDRSSYFKLGLFVIYQKENPSQKVM